MQKKKKRKQNKKIIKLTLILAIFLLIIFALIISRNSKQKIEQYASLEKSEYSIEVGLDNTILNFDTAIAKTNAEVNKPRIGAGMIPIIPMDDGTYKITTFDNSNWYDYFSNKPAYMMLSNGYYKSELEQGIDEEKQLVENNINKEIPNDSNILGSIYVWVPRFAYSENEMGFLKETRIVNAINWKTPSIFTVQAKTEIELTGIWVEKNIENYNNLDTINSKFNTYGIIANEKVSKADEVTVEILTQFNKHFNLKKHIGDISNFNRTYMQVINSSLTQELVVTAHIEGKSVKIDILANKYPIAKIVNAKTGEVVQNNTYEIKDSRKNIFIYSNRYSRKYGNV